jgi:C4-dicarboxylate transporter, DctM subunit
VTEAAALSAVVAILISVFVYRETKPRGLLAVLAEAMQNSAAIMIIIATALVFGHWITESGLAPWLIATLKGWNLEAWHFLLIVNVILLIMGMFLEVFSVLLIAMPVIVPLLKPLGIDPVHFGIVVTINMELALLTPPVGMNLFVLSTITRAPLAEVIRGTTPFIVLMLILLIAITYIPAISLWLPRMILG